MSILINFKFTELIKLYMNDVILLHKKCIIIYIPTYYIEYEFYDLNDMHKIEILCIFDQYLGVVYVCNTNMFLMKKSW